MTGTVLWCPFCWRYLRDAAEGYDHAYNHQDKAPYAHLIEEEYREIPADVALRALHIDAGVPGDGR